MNFRFESARFMIRLEIRFWMSETKVESRAAGTPVSFPVRFNRLKTFEKATETVLSYYAFISQRQRL